MAEETTVPVSEQVSFTDQQKAHIEKEMQARLERAQRVHDATAAQIQAESNRRVLEAKEEAAVADKFLQESARRDEALAHEKTMLNKWFGPGSSSAEASKLFAENPATYRALRLRAQNCGLLPKDRLSIGQAVANKLNGKK